jgi:large subunit ribosomal protein L18
MQTKRLHKARRRRQYSVRKKVFGTPDAPRLSVYRSNRHIYAQIIDDVAGVTLASASTRSKGIREKTSKCGNKTAAEAVGTAVAKHAAQVGIKRVRFDRGRYKFHGRVQVLAQAARKAGLVF